MLNDANKNVVLIAKGSKAGEAALFKALEIANELKCNKLFMLFVADNDFFAGDGSGFSKSEESVNEGLDAIGDAILRKLINIAKEMDEKIKVETIVLHGNTASEILDFVKNNKIDVLVIPRDKRGPIEKSLTGGDIEPFIKEISNYTKLILVE